MDLVNYVLANLPAILSAATSIVGAFAIIATLTPNTQDDTIVGYLTQAIHFLGANFGNAKSVPANPTPPAA